MANTLLTISMITREALRVLENNITFTKFVRRDFDGKFAVSGAKIGTTLNIRKPPRYVGRRGQALAIEDAIETSVPLVLNQQYGVDIQFSSQDLALSIDDFSKRFLAPAIAKVANDIDFDGMQQYMNIYNAIGVPGVVPAALLTYLQGGQRMDEEAAPRDGDRSMVISPAMEATIVNALSTFFNPAKSIADQYDSGLMGRAIGFKWSMDQNVATHTVGPLGGTPLIDGANQTGTSILTKGWTGAVATRLNVGDVISFAGSYAVNPQSKQSTGSLRQFVVTQLFQSDVAGKGAVQVYPALTTTGPFQTVTASPADGAAVTIFGHASNYHDVVTPQGLAFHKDAFAFGCADLPLPGGVDMAARVTDDQLGMSMRLVRAYDINSDQFPCRIDVLGGWTTLYPELACRMVS